jgi:RNA polymerase sigma-70 factor (ECF subfamily)
MNDPLSNEQLARAAQQGSRASFAELVVRFQTPLVHFFCQRAKSHADAEDLTQDVFIRAYRHLDRYSSDWCFSTWIYTIAHRLCLNAERVRQPHADSLALDGLTSATKRPDEQLDAVESSGQLWRRAAAVLTSSQLTAVWLFYVEGLPPEQIARVVGKSAFGVKGLLFRARRKLSKILKTPEHGKSPTGRHTLSLLPPRLAAELSHE